LPFDFTDCDLTSLTCTGALLIDISSNRTQALNLEKTAAIYSKLLTPQKIEDLFRIIHGSKTEYLDQNEACKFNAFIFKNFSRLGDATTTQQIASNQCIFNSCISSAVHLEELNLSYQAIKVIPDEISKLTNLKRLNLQSCILLTSISPQLSKLEHLTHLNLDNCVSLKTPPPEIRNRGLASIITYLKGLLAGSVACKRTKLMLVGNTCILYLCLKFKKHFL
jgi:hypothetical protein